MSTFSHIRGLGFHVPERLYTNTDLEKFVDTNDEWITTRTGIKQRHVVEDETCLDLAYEASLKALKAAGMKAEELTHVIIATFTGDMPVPTTSCLLMERWASKTGQPWTFPRPAPVLFMLLRWPGHSSISIPLLKFWSAAPKS